jgi:hypothetical protein
VSEQQSEPVSGQTGAEMAAKSEPVAANVEAPRLSPEQEETSPSSDAPKLEAAKVEPPKVEPPKIELPGIEPSRIELPKAETGAREEPRFPGTMMIMAPSSQGWDHETATSKPAQEQAAKPSGTRRIAAMAAVIALAAVAGAIGGALATAGLGHFANPAMASSAAASTKDSSKDTLETALARIDGEISALKSTIDQTARAGTVQFNKTNERLEKVEKAQAEPMARLAKLSEAVDKLRTTPPVTVAAAAPTPVAAKEVTGTVPSPAPAAAAASAAPKAEVGRLPIVEGWALRDVGNGGALIEGRQGMYEVYAGDPVPGLGRVDAIRKQDGRWVVVTSRGLIVAR